MPSYEPISAPVLKFSSGLLARNTFYSLFGQVLPLFVAVITIPFLVDGLGLERFGVLTIAWMVVGYFSLFDMGIGRATTKFIAELSAQGAWGEVRDIYHSSLLLLSLFGVVGGTLLALATGWFVDDLLNIPPDLIEETRQSLYLLSGSIPAVMLIAGARGALEAQQKFRAINYIKIPSAIATFILPMLVLPFSESLVPMVALLAGAKVITLLCYLVLSNRCLPRSGSRSRICSDHFKRLLRFGGWLSITHLIAPLLGYIDRFFIGSMLTMTAVAYYATPFDVVGRLFIIPSGILVVMFPVFSALSTNEPARLSRLYHRTTKYILFAMTPLVVAIIVFAQPLLSFWLGKEFADNSAVVLQILGSGVLFSSTARVPLNATQAIGRPDIGGKYYLVVLPFVLTALYFVTGTLGVVGIALIWLSRIILEATVMFYYGHRLVALTPLAKTIGSTGVFVWIVTTVGVSWLVSMIPYMIVRSLVAIVLIGGGCVIAFVRLLDESERNQLAAGYRKIQVTFGLGS